ncbi:RNA-binding protein [Methanothermobacter wolfeii]|uniref:RNA-binding protein n=1 Tax=Methanothermobacter wolfeii TaxID=145261 RepID=UPI0024B33DC4|nr:RNA-binding protein [Methanothermobacter wolfeii]MDI6701410.1 RNA-binding protein [Methanothermobacter wolfeii]MDI6842069.1 RNA-binding protein [Methanothermobacter wolfeii]
MNVKVRKRYHLKKKKLREIKEGLGDYAGIIPDRATVEILETDDENLILVDGRPMVMLIDDKPFPTLKGALGTEIEKGYVVVDMGAVRFLANGADVMSPGIVDADPMIGENDTVIVVDEKHRKPLAVGISLMSGPEMVEKDSGKAVKTIHYIGDRIWNLEV